MVEASDERVEATIESLSLETKVGQLFIYVQSGSPTQPDEHDRDFFRRYRPGGVIVYDRNVDSREQIGAYLAGLQGLNAELGYPGPLVVCVDHRGGDHAILEPDASGLEFPAPIAQTAIDDDLEAVGEEIGAALGRDVLDVGFNLNLAPYADFLERGDIEKFVFGNSMMGSDPEANAALSRGLVRGMRSAGVGATYCVFPGGYGSLDRDPHHFPGAIEAGEAEIRDRYLTAPRAAFDAGAEAVMLSHRQFPALDPESRPGTYSPPVIRDLLRDELGFDGLVMTDAIKMSGATEHAGSSEEAAIRAINAGADMILCADWDERLAVEAAVRDGRISEERVDDALRRVIRLKSSLSESGPEVQAQPDPVDQGRMATRIEQSLGWLRRSDQNRSLSNANRVVGLATWREFLAAVGRVGGETAATLRIPESGMLSDVSVGDRVELVDRQTTGDEHLVVGTSSEADLELADALHNDGHEVSVVHCGAVFDVETLSDVPTVLLCYSHQPIAVRKAIEVLYGEAVASGEIPVSLDF